MVERINDNTLRTAVGKIDVKHFCPSERLFSNKRGSPMLFNVLPSSDRDMIVELIKAGGGTVIDGDAVENTGAITISSGALATENNTEVFSSAYIYVSCFYGEHIDVEEFRLISDPDDDPDQSVAVNEKNDFLIGARQSETRLSLEEMHRILIYIRNSKRLWKEIEDNKICGNKPWKAVQQEFTFWALKKFHEIALLNTGNTCDLNVLDHQHQSMNGCHEVNLAKNSRVANNEVPCIEMVHEENGKMLFGLEKESSSKEADACSLRKKNPSYENIVSDSEEDDVSHHNLRKQVAGRLSAVIDDDSASESGEQVGGLECSEREVMHSDGGKDAVVSRSERIEETGKEVVPGNSRDEDNSVCLVSDHSSETSRNTRARGALSRYNTPRACNVWLSKGETIREWGKVDVVTSTPAIRKALSKGDESDKMEEEADECGCKSSTDNGKPKAPFQQRLYTHKEDMEILKWLCCKRKRSHDSLKGNRLWQFMESRKVIPGRSWQSMRERFRRHISPNINDYPIPPEDKKKLLREIR